MPWPRAAQRVLLVAAAGLLALAAALGGGGGRRPASSPVPDDPALEIRLDLNRATAADLETLPGVGVALAGRIERHRLANGPFHSVDELSRVPGVGEKLAASLRPLLTVR